MLMSRMILQGWETSSAKLNWGRVSFSTCTSTHADTCGLTQALCDGYAISASSWCGRVMRCTCLLLVLCRWLPSRVGTGCGNNAARRAVTISYSSGVCIWAKRMSPTHSWKQHRCVHTYWHMWVCWGLVMLSLLPYSGLLALYHVTWCVTWPVGCSCM